MTEYNQSFEEEQERFHEVKTVIKNRLNKLMKRVKRIRTDVLDLRKEFFEDVTVNLTEMDDAIETQASLKQQAEFLSERERHHDQQDQSFRQLTRLYDQPYFGRIDFKEDGETAVDAIYIGTSSLLKKNEEDFYVYDWRAPIASMYYDYPPGASQYQAIDETITGEMTLKRQYVVKRGELEGMFDTGLTIGDGLLQQVLGETADTTMKNIVATIQQEQNKIIRHEKKKDLIVQGVAGSGKTSAALQRIAYLLYRFRGELTAEQMLLFSPNPLFHTYVSQVLPELGEDQIEQVTFYHYLEQELGRRFVIETPFDQLEVLLTGEVTESRQVNMQYKASLQFKEKVDHYLEQLKYRGLAFRNIRFRDHVIVSKQELSRYFYKMDQNESVQVRLSQLRDFILASLKEEQKQLMDADWLEDELELLDLDDYQAAYEQIEGEQDTMDWFNQTEREQQILKLRLINKLFKPLRKKIKRLQFVDTKRTYLRLFDHADATDEQFNHVRLETRQQLLDNFLTYEDATPFLYFEKVCLGFDEQGSIQHVILDEAQDYSLFQLAYLKRIYPNSQMTLLGDVHQTLYLHGLNDDHVLKSLTDADVLTLNKSYRATEQLVNFSKGLAKQDAYTIEPFVRQGDKPNIYEVETEQMMMHKIYDELQAFQAQGFEQLAIITKTKQEAKKVTDWLQLNDTQAHLVTVETHEFEPGIKVLPVYLAKGIEFDAVIVYDVSEKHYYNELDQYLLYTASTRAMHALTLVSHQTVAPWLKAVDASTYQHHKIMEIQLPKKGDA
ncbi:DNA helicase-2 / ATP-dependent DNA helicase PcrA [Halolactibacillus halophilus]|uniref:DNA 3'-5' helicase n=1 Tax=Halolactibacillus halophilus TaxID=306540 RepID=A0A1I5P0U8_9BACI|nr:RNA polymerase recycling motor HelD [Halolactibacillus halophilus]GEM01552.1 helicase IV [Halolactibacillus halophilus]SFP27480.1 DNA helicase-2 / ATP-dependent DNA helicase PcrA [Halolactibacillus halophilus]